MIDFADTVLDFPFDVVNDDIGEVFSFSSLDYIYDSFNDVASFDASAIEDGTPTEINPAAIGLCDDDLLAMLFSASADGITIQLPDAALIDAADADLADAQEPVATAEVISMTAYALAKAAMAAKPPRRRRQKFVDSRQMSLF